MEAESLLATTAEVMAVQVKLANTLDRLSSMLASEANEEYVTVDELVKALGPAFSKRQIMEDLRAGFFKLGRDYINLSNGARPTYAFKVSKIRQVYETDPAKRKMYS